MIMKSKETVIAGIIRKYALLHISKIFNIHPENINAAAVFGVDLKASFVSDFKDNELDQLLYDIRDVADRETLKRLNSGSLVIRSVTDYCDHMIHCYEVKPKVVIRVLQLPI